MTQDTASFQHIFTILSPIFYFSPDNLNNQNVSRPIYGYKIWLNNNLSYQSNFIPVISWCVWVIRDRKLQSVRMWSSDCSLLIFTSFGHNHRHADAATKALATRSCCVDEPYTISTALQRYMKHHAEFCPMKWSAYIPLSLHDAYWNERSEDWFSSSVRMIQHENSQADFKEIWYSMGFMP
jgi:hypothetical protein